MPGYYGEPATGPELATWRKARFVSASTAAEWYGCTADYWQKAEKEPVCSPTIARVIRERLNTERVMKQLNKERGAHNTLLRELGRPVGRIGHRRDGGPKKKKPEPAGEVIDLMAALKRSLAGAPAAAPPQPTPRASPPD